MRYAAVALIIGVFLLAGPDTQSFANPDLASCRVCGDKVAKEAAACPHCGAPDPYRGGLKTTWHNFENGQKKKEGKLIDGKKEGIWTEWYEDGQKRSERTFQDDNLLSASVWKPNGKPCPITNISNGSGILVEYHSNGQKLNQLTFKNSKKEGIQIWWHENGQKMGESHFKDGSYSSWYENGNKKEESHYKDGSREGLLISYHLNGVKSFEAHRKGFSWEGLMTRWDENGNKTQEIQYENGFEVNRKEFEHGGEEWYE